MKLDLHIHSSFSPDAINPPEAICKAAIQKGLGGFALTDHNTTAGWEDVRKAAERAGLLFIPGVEQKVTVKGQVVGEVLCLFLRDPIRSHDLAGIITEAEGQGGLVVAAHPFDHRRPALGRSGGIMEHLHRIALEVLNGRGYTGQGNREAAACAKAYNLPVTAGSDAHTPFEVGNVCVEAEIRTVEALKQAIRDRQVRVAGRVSHPVFSLYSGIRKFGFGR